MLIDEVTSAIADAMRTKDQFRLGTLRMLKAGLMNRAVERKRDLDDAESRQVVTSLVKQRRDSIEQFVAGGRQDLADREAAEIRILESYLPPPIDADTLERLVTETIARLAATSSKDMGRVMKAVMGELGGASVDGKLVSDLVRARLTSS